jgi:hypothetical protein
VATIEEDSIFGKRRGFAESRHLATFRRELSGDHEDEMTAWFKQTKVPVGESVKEDPDKRKQIIRLLYTWMDMFITDTTTMVGTDLMIYSIPTWDDAVPVRAKGKLSTPRERAWMELNLLKPLEAKIINHSLSPWCRGTKFVPKKDRDLRMVHVYCPINAATIPNAYPMKRIEPVLYNLLRRG